MNILTLTVRNRFVLPGMVTDMAVDGGYVTERLLSYYEERAKGGVGLALGSGAYLLGNQLLGIYSSDPEVIAFGMKRMAICCVLQCVGGLMGVMVGTLRGMG